MNKPKTDYTLVEINGTNYPIGIRILEPNEEIPPIQRPRNTTKAILIKAGFKHVTETGKKRK
ncbi:MAG: hypothetical protein ABSG57_08035 [Candidatus Bathyarchaeia archaeon]